MPAADMTDKQLKEEIERTPDGARRDALLHDAIMRPTYPLSWLPYGLSLIGGDYRKKEDHA